MVRKKPGPKPIPPQHRSRGYIGVLVRQDEKDLWKEAALLTGESLSAWVANRVRRTLNGRVTDNKHKDIASELLTALREVVRISDRRHDAWDLARAAIAKAEGKREQ